VGSVRDLETLAEEITERVVETLLTERGLFILQNPYSGRLEVHESFGYTVEEQALFDLKPDAGLLGESFASHLPLRREGQDLAALPERAGFETQSMLLVPILFSDVTIGAIFVGNKQGGEPFTNDDVVLLTGVAMQVSTAVENARNVEEREARERHHRVYITY
jgi:GAF domain-containing protein